MTSAERSYAMVLSLLMHCLLLFPMFCLGFMFDPCFVVHCLVSFLVLQSFCWGKESWLLYFNYLLMSFELVFCVSS